MGRHAVDLKGRRFGRLLVLGRGQPGIATTGTGKHTWWRCRCDCGMEAHVQSNRLVHGRTRSCGCLRTAPRPRKKSEAGFRRQEHAPTSAPIGSDPALDGM